MKVLGGVLIFLGIGLLQCVPMSPIYLVISGLFFYGAYLCFCSAKAKQYPPIRTGGGGFSGRGGGSSTSSSSDYRKTTFDGWTSIEEDGGDIYINQGGNRSRVNDPFGDYTTDPAGNIQSRSSDESFTKDCAGNWCHYEASSNDGSDDNDDSGPFFSLF